MLSVAVCGLGPRGIEHLSMLASADGLKLAGVCDTSPERRAVAAEQVDVPAFQSLQTMLDEVSPDVVVLALPASSRLEPIRSITRCSSVRAVVIEKPLALTGEEANEILALC